MPSSRRVRKIRTAISPRLATSTFENGAISRVFSLPMSLADQLTLVRVLAVPVVIVLFLASFNGHDYWATAVFIVAMSTDWFDGRVARRRGRTSELGSLLDPVADKLLVLTTLIMLVGEASVQPGWWPRSWRASSSSPASGSRRSSAAWSCAPATSAS